MSFIFKDNEDCAKLRDELRATLLRNARGVFQWAKIWLDILLAVEDTDRRAIKSETDAQKWLVRLQKDSRELATEHELLTKGYQRLWDITCIREHDDFKQRARLFQFVLASNDVSTIQMLSTALRICNDKFDRYPQPEAIMRLCSDFLFLNTKGFLEFVHSSALNFIRDLNMEQDKLAEGDEEKFFSDHRNHESIARLYMDLIGSATHPYWTQMGIEMNKWNDYAHAHDSREGRLIIQKFITNKGLALDGNLAAYFARYGLTHFSNAARKRSLDDPIWKDFIRRLVLPSDSAFGAFLLNQTDALISEPIWGKYHPRFDSRSSLRLEGGRLRILPSHVLACLPVFDEYDHVPSTSTRDTSGALSYVEFLKDMCTLGGNFEDALLEMYYDKQPTEITALHLACDRRNPGAVRAIIYAAKLLLSTNTLSEMLRLSDRTGMSPLGIAIFVRNVTIPSMLLEADRQPVSVNADPGGLEVLSSTYTSSQWETLMWNESRPMEDPIPLSFAALFVFDEKDMLSLLKVARPENINAHYGPERKTFLHWVAEVGMSELACALVQNYGADKTAKDVYGRTPFELGAGDEDLVLSEHS